MYQDLLQTTNIKFNLSFALLYFSLQHLAVETMEPFLVHHKNTALRNSAPQSFTDIKR